MIALLSDSDMLRALGYSLADNLWQMAAVWAVYAGITRNGKKLTASQRYSLAAGGIAVGLCLFVATFLTYYFGRSEAGYLPFGPGILRAMPNYLSENGKYLESAGRLIAIAYIATVFVLTMRLVFIYIKSRQNKSIIPPPAKESLRRFVDQTACKLGISRRIRLIISRNTGTPFTLGFFKPVILLPFAALNGLTVPQLEAVICHELLHIKRHDYLFNLLLSFAGVLMFYNPFARRLLQIAGTERENRCDDAVLGLGYNNWQYSEALLQLGRQSTHSRLSLAFTGSGTPALLHRVRRIMNLPRSVLQPRTPPVLFFLCLIPSVLLYLTGGNRTEDAKNDIPGYASLQQVRKNSSESTGRPGENRIIILAPPATERLKPPPSPPVAQHSEKHANPSPNHSNLSPAAPEIIHPPQAPKEDRSLAEHPLLILDKELNLLQATFVTGNQFPRDFTILEPVVIAPMDIPLGTKPLPYVPGNTFYHPDLETDSAGVEGTEVIQL